MTGQRCAVIIGVDDSGIDVQLPQLRYAEKDARAMGHVLSDPEIGTFDPADVRLFVGPQTTAAEIKAALRTIVLDSSPSDVLLIYFAGHTLTPAWSGGTDMYLVTPDLREAELSANPDAGLRMAFLKRDVLDLFAGTSLLVLDCCRAGDFLDVDGRGVDMISVEGRSAPRHSALVACPKDGGAREDPEREQGILTHHVLRALRGKAMDDHGRVTFSAVCGYVAEQGLAHEPAQVIQSWGGTTVLTRPGHDAVGTGRHASPPLPADVDIVELENPLERFVTPITRLLVRLSRSARVPRQPTAAGDRNDEVVTVSRVEYLKSALEAESVALLEYTPAGFRTIDATARFDLNDLQPMLQSFPLSRAWFGHVARDDGSRRLLCVPLSYAEGKSLVLALVNPAPAFLEIGQPLAKILETVWRTDFAASPLEAEIQVLTALRAAFGRVPTRLFDRCFQLYQEVLESFSMVFQPVITIGRAARNVGVHSYEALARRSLTDQRAPVAMLQVAHVWGDRFVIERDEIIVRKAVSAYARAHAQGPWDVPKPVSINVAVRSLLSDSYVEVVRHAMAAAHLEPGAVTLEISEQDPIEPRLGEQWSEEPHVYFHKRLAAMARDIGVAFAVDDFGVGYSSLSRMAELPLTQIKVDRAVLHHPLAVKELALVVDVARYASDRGDTHAQRVVIVEGVDDESPVTLQQIFDQRIRHVQGYITREPAAPTIRRLKAKICEELAALVRGEDTQRQAAAEDFPLRRGA